MNELSIRFQRAIKAVHGVDSVLERRVRVCDQLVGEAVFWEGVVLVFKLLGHPRAAEPRGQTQMGLGGWEALRGPRSLSH